MTAGSDTSLLVRVTQPGGLMYNNLSGDRRAKAGIIYDWPEGTGPKVAVVRYPTASSPQAWATAAPFLWLRLILGAEPVDGALQVDPRIPAEFGRVAVRGLHAFGKRWNVAAEGDRGTIAAAPPSTFV